MSGAVFIRDGEERYFHTDQFADAEAEGWSPRGGQRLLVKEDVEGSPAMVVSAKDAPAMLEQRQGTTIASPEEAREQYWEQAREETYGGAAGTLGAIGAGAARGLTLGLSDLLLEGTGAVDAETLRDLEATHPIASAGAEIAGVVGPALLTGGAGLGARAAARTPAGLLARGGEAIAARGAGAGVLGKAAYRGIAGAAEGAVIGAGETVSDLATSEDPLDAERAVSVLGSNMLYGLAAGGIAGAGTSVVADAAGKGLIKGRRMLQELSERTQRQADMPEQFLGKSKKEIREIRATEKVKAKEQQLRDLDDVTAAMDTEADRLRAVNDTERADIADDIISWARKERNEFVWRAVQEGDNTEVLEAMLSRDVSGLSRREIDAALKASPKVRALREAFSRRKAETNKLRKLVDVPKDLVEYPKKALSSLRAHEAQLVKLLESEDDLSRAITKIKRARSKKWWEDKGLTYVETGRPVTSSRIALLKNIAPDLLESNRALQQRIVAASDDYYRLRGTRQFDESLSPVMADLRATQRAIKARELTTPLMQQADEVLDAMAQAPGKGFAQRVFEGAVMGAGTVAAAPVVGFTAGGIGSAKLAEWLGGVVFGRIGKAGAEQTARIGMAIERLVGKATTGASRVAPVVAAKTLSRVAYAPPQAAPALQRAAAPAATKLHRAYRDREGELRSQTTIGPDGATKMRPSSREKLARTFDPVRVLNPMLADKMETAAARRIAYLASRLPKRPDYAVIDRMTNAADNWYPSSMEMAEFARSVAAVEDPASVVERLVDGSIAPEDADAIRNVYPEMYADIQAQIVASLPKLRATLPYHRRLALSIFSGAPVDPALHPRVLRVLQGNFANEFGTDGGVQPPQPQPQFGAFGSPKKDDATPAQERMAT